MTESAIPSSLSWVCRVLIGLLVLLLLVESSCFPDKKQKCDKLSTGKDLFNTSIRALMFTRRNRKDPEMLHLCGGRLPKQSTFNPQNRLIVFISGFMLGVCDLETVIGIKDEFLIRGDYNLLLLEPVNHYGSDYTDSSHIHVPKAAEAIVALLRTIQEMTGLRSDQLYVIGHSLGAHTAGQVGKLMDIGRITGLDPANVNFDEDVHTDLRLDRSDADLVDILHCSGGNALPNMAIRYSAGDADFYINGGSIQPNCHHSAWESLKNFNLGVAFATLTIPSMCAHLQCMEYYRLAINYQFGNWTAWPCDNYDDFKRGLCTGPEAGIVVMGFDFEKYFKPNASPKQYFLDTAPDWPFVTSNGTYGENNGYV